MTCDRLHFGWLAGVLLVSAWASVRASDSPLAGAPSALHVELLDGSRVHGQLDGRTDRSALCLVFSERGVQVRRSIPWSKIARVTEDGAAVTADDLLETGRELPSVGDDPLAQPRFTVSRLPTAGAPPPLPCITSLDAVVEVQSWDGDVESDGLLLRLIPRGQGPWALPAQGQLTVRLLGRRFDSRRGALRFVELDRWQQFVRPQQFERDGAAFRLPYRATQPDFEMDVGSEALVHLRFQAQGSKPFELSLPIRLRQADWARDQHQLGTGSRFLPGETTRAGRPSYREQGLPRF